MSSPLLFHRISDAAALRAQHAREPAAQTDHLREVLQHTMELLSPRQLRSLEEVPAIKDLLDSAAGLAE
jgi:hypothetical protein